MRKLSAIMAVAGVLLATAARAQQEPADYPSRTIRVVVSAPAGGGVDIVARLIADRLQQLWGHPVVVENRSGAGGNLGAELVAQADPDGYTLLAAQPAPLTTNVSLYKKLNFDPAAFEPIAIMTTIPNALVVRKDFPANTVAELIAYAKANPGKINYGSQGTGTTPHLTAELFARMTGTQLTHVPYRGTAAAVNDLVAGHLDLLFMQIDAVREHFQAGKIKMLAVATNERVDTVKDIPTAIEAGVPGFTSDTWNAIVAPPKTPAPVVAKLNRAIVTLLKRPDVTEHLQKLNMQPIGGKPEDIRKFVAEETTRWAEVIKAAGITAN
jgi:tripartite-type tricarboxylate transporter receptor subunit TctC